MQLASAFGKLILLGEHAVVYGVPALVVGIERGLQATVEAAEQSGLRLLALDVEGSAQSNLAKAFRALRACVQEQSLVELPTERVIVVGDLPPGVGLGFSAAAAVATARALLGSAELPAQVDRERLVFEAATAWERVFHGNPSGVDVAAALGGGCLEYRLGQQPIPLRQKVALRLCVGLSGVASSTKEMVERVAQQAKRDPQRVQDLWQEVDALVRRGRAAIEEGRTDELADAMQANRRVLDALELSTPAIDTLCLLALRRGAMAAKLTGAGGGGSVVALVGNDSEEARQRAHAIVQAWRGEGLDGFDLVLRADPKEIS